MERHTLEGFATYVVSHSPNSVQGLMDQLHSMIHPDTDQGNVFLHQSVLELIAKVLQVITVHVNQLFQVKKLISIPCCTIGHMFIVLRYFINKHLLF